MSIEHPHRTHRATHAQWEKQVQAAAAARFHAAVSAGQSGQSADPAALLAALAAAEQEDRVAADTGDDAGLRWTDDGNEGVAAAAAGAAWGGSLIGVGVGALAPEARMPIFPLPVSAPPAHVLAASCSISFGFALTAKRSALVFSHHCNDAQGDGSMFGAGAAGLMDWIAGVTRSATGAASDAEPDRGALQDAAAAGGESSSADGGRQTRGGWGEARDSGDLGALGGGAGGASGGGVRGRLRGAREGSEPWATERERGEAVVTTEGEGAGMLQQRRVARGSDTARRREALAAAPGGGGGGGVGGGGGAQLRRGRRRGVPGADS